MRANASGGAVAADAALAPVMELHLASRAAALQGASARAAQLRTSALDAARAALPADSLVTIALAWRVINPRLAVQEDSDAPLPQGYSTEEVLAHAARVIQVMTRRDDDGPEEERMPATEERLQLLLRCLEVLHARWRAGTLHTPSAAEAAFFQGSSAREAPEVCGANLYVECALLAAGNPDFWQQSDQRLRAVAGAMRAALEAFARGDLAPRPAAPDIREHMALAHPIRSLDNLLEAVLTEERGLLQPLRSAHGLRRAEEAQLREMWAQRRNTFFSDGTVFTPRENAARIAPFAAALFGQQTDVDAADAESGTFRFCEPAPRGRHACTLPACAASEPQGAPFQVCARCRGARYCCAAHQAEDWRRHKRMECVKPPAAAADNNKKKSEGGAGGSQQARAQRR
jgi:hypothetical protein